MNANEYPWPPAGKIERIWESNIPDSGLVPLAEKNTFQYQATIPPKIASLQPPVDENTKDLLTNASLALKGLVPHSQLGGTMEKILFRTEAVNSSRIEGYETNYRNLAIALIGGESKPGALITAFNLLALETAINDNKNQKLSVESICSIHAQLMKLESFAGQLRDVQNWIGGSGFSPYNAAHIPPPPEYVVDALNDLVDFMARDDLNPVLKLSIAHAQFEAIHPFIDGNGRTGRALSQVILVQNELPPVPISVGLFALRGNYYESLSRYVEGDIAPTISLQAKSILVACFALHQIGGKRDSLADKWRELLNIRRKGSTVDRAVDWILENPAFTSSQLSSELSASSAETARTIKRFSDCEILSKSRRSKEKSARGGYEIIWEANEVYVLAESLEQEIVENISGRR